MSNLKECLFYRNSKQELEQILGVSDIAEIERKNEIVLPSDIFEYAKNDLKATLKDTRERYKYFGIKEGNICVLKEGIGSELKVKDSNVKGEIRMGIIRGVWDTFIAKPISVFLHDHPNLTDECIKGKDFQAFYESLNIEQIREYINMVANYFSPADLGLMEAKGKYIRSMLLAAPGGYTWIINPNFNGFPNPLVFDSFNYDRDFQGIFEFIRNRMLQSKNTEIDKNKWDRSLLQKLDNFCMTKGYVGFYNRDPNSPKLVTLRYNP